MMNPESATPRIDVLIPVYNAESTIVEAVESMLKQTITDIRVIVVDDGSTDGTERKLAALAASDRRLIVHRQPNGGIVDALNNGLKLCDSEFVARHDADDIAFPERLETQLDYLLAHPDCVAVGANAFHIDESGRRTGTLALMKDPTRADVDFFPAVEPYLMHPLLLVRRASLVESGGYRYVFYAEDTDLYWRLRAFGRLHNIDSLLAEYRIHTNSISGKSVINGRIQAVNSQLASVSERRRERHQPDLKFPRERIDLFHRAKSIKSIMAIAEDDLEPQELPPFRLAVAAKMLELVSYRPYALDLDDRMFVKSTLVQHAGLLTAYNLEFLNKRQAKYFADLLRKRQFRAATQVFRPSLGKPIAQHFSAYFMRRIIRRWQPLKPTV